MNAVKTFFAGMFAMLLLAVVGYAVWIIATDGRFPSQNLLNSVPNPSGIVIDTSAPATVVFSQPPQIVTATPGAPAVVLESLDTSPTPTAEFAPTPEFSPGFLAACAGGMARGERVSPRCPSNAAEMLGTGR